jgi:hypothetical protein
MHTSRVITRLTTTFVVTFALAATALAQGVFPPSVENPAVSDQKAGSVLVFPYYNSDASGDFTKSDTLITITNVTFGPATTLGLPNYSFLHLFFISGSNCSPADTYLCLTPGGSLQIRVSEYDPMVRGYLVAVAMDENGAPTENNSFIGSAFIRDNTNGIIDSYGAEAFQKLNNNPVQMDPDGSAVISLNGADYEAVPRQFTVQLQDPNVSDQTIVLVSVSGDLGTGMAATGQSGVGVLYRADEMPASFQPKFTGCQVLSDVTNANFRVVPGPLTNFLKDSYGYLKFNVSGPAVGLLLSRQAAGNATKNRYAGVRALHKTATGAATLRMPMFPPFCGF